MINTYATIGGMDDHTVTGRVVAVLDAVAALDDAATLAALTRRTGIPKPTVRRIASDLVTRGLLVRHADRYQLGPRLLEFTSHAARQQGIRHAAIPHVQDLFARTGEIVWVSAFTDTSNALLHSAFGTNRAADMQRPWPNAIRSPGFLTTAAGRILLTDRPELAEHLHTRSLPRLTPYTLTHPAKIATAIKTARDTGIAIEHEESLLGYSCIAAGVRGPDQRVIGVIGVLGRVGNFTAERLTRPLLAAAADVEHTLRQTQTT